MPEEPKQPWVVLLSRWLVKVAAPLVPGAQREDWRRDWNAEIFHRWQFLFHTNEWSVREQALLLLNSIGSLFGALSLWAEHSGARAKAVRVGGSPIACLSLFAIAILGIGAFSSGFHATREMLFSQMAAKDGQLTFVWLHPFIGGGDKGLPVDVVPAWNRDSKLLKDAAGIDVRHTPVTWNKRTIQPLVITGNPNLFHLLGVSPLLGQFPASRGVVLDRRAFAKFAHSDPKTIGSPVSIFGLNYILTGVLPGSFEFLSKEPTFYLLDTVPPVSRVFVVARAKPGVTDRALSKELSRISEEACYYFNFRPQMRFATWRGVLLTPLATFGIAAGLSCLLAIAVFFPRWHQLKRAWTQSQRRATLQRGLFFLAKTALALLAVFLAGLEWSRSESSVLLANRDPGNGPLLLWLFVLGTMGVVFWAVADQRARCRVCLRLMAFPVRIGCPGSLLLDWSGTELFCSEGHGLLHVPLMAPSWDEESDRWIALDDSWSGLFVHEKPSH